jgi:hypothetical protein
MSRREIEFEIELIFLSLVVVGRAAAAPLKRATVDRLILGLCPKVLNGDRRILRHLRREGSTGRKIAFMPAD